MTERLEQLPSELDQKVVLVRAPLDLEDLVDRVLRIAGTRNEHGALVAPRVRDETAVGVGLVFRDRRAHATRAGLEVQLVRLEAVEGHRLLEDQADVLDMDLWEEDFGLRVHAVRRGRRVGLRASPAASRGSLCAVEAGSQSQRWSRHH